MWILIQSGAFSEDEPRRDAGGGAGLSAGPCCALLSGSVETEPALAQYTALETLHCCCSRGGRIIAPPADVWRFTLGKKDAFW